MKIQFEIEYLPQFQQHVQLVAIFDGPGIEFGERIDVSRIAMPQENSGQSSANSERGNTTIQVCDAENDDSLIQ